MLQGQGSPKPRVSATGAGPIVPFNRLTSINRRLLNMPSVLYHEFGYAMQAMPGSPRHQQHASNSAVPDARTQRRGACLMQSSASKGSGLARMSASRLDAVPDLRVSLAEQPGQQSTMTLPTLPLSRLSRRSGNSPFMQAPFTSSVGQAPSPAAASPMVSTAAAAGAAADDTQTASGHGWVDMAGAGIALPEAEVELAEQATAQNAGTQLAPRRSNSLTLRRRASSDSITSSTGSGVAAPGPMRSGSPAGQQQQLGAHQLTSSWGSGLVALADRVDSAGNAAWKEIILGIGARQNAHRRHHRPHHPHSRRRRRSSLPGEHEQRCERDWEQQPASEQPASEQGYEPESSRTEPAKDSVDAAAASAAAAALDTAARGGSHMYDEASDGSLPTNSFAAAATNNFGTESGPGLGSRPGTSPGPEPGPVRQARPHNSIRDGNGVRDAAGIPLAIPSAGSMGSTSSTTTRRPSRFAAAAATSTQHGAPAAGTVAEGTAVGVVQGADFVDTAGSEGSADVETASAKSGTGITAPARAGEAGGAGQEGVARMQGHQERTAAEASTLEEVVVVEGSPPV